MIQRFTHVLLLAAGLCSALLTGCKKDEKVPDAPAPASGALTVHDNVRVVDSTRFRLDHNPTLLAAGTYRFTGAGAALDVPVGAVIVGAQGRGFLRKVTAVSIQGTQTTLQTQFASLDELFKSGTLTLRSSSDSLHQRGTAGTGFTYAISNVPVFQSGALNMSLRSGSISLNPQWKIEAAFGPNGTINAEVAARNALLTGTFVFNVTASQAVTLVNRSSTLAHFYKDFKVVLAIGGVPVPVTVRMNVDLGLEYSANVGAAVSRDVTFTNSTTFDAGMAYTNGGWQGIYSLTPTNTLNIGPRSGQANATVQMALVPKVSFQLYEEFAFQEILAVGPYASIGLQEEIQGNVASPSLDWNFQVDAWLRTTVGLTGKVFGKQLPDFNKSWDSGKLTYKNPASLERTGGDGQSGGTGQALPIPIKVRVLDSKGDPQSGVPVYFTLASGNGSASPASILTDANGYAQTTWTLGATAGVKHLSATAKLANGQPVTGGPLDFSATAGCAEDPALLALLTGGSSKTWRLVLQNGRTVTPYCGGNYDTQTFTAAHQFTQVVWGDNPPVYCVSHPISFAFVLCGQRLGVMNAGQFVEFHTIVSATASRLVISRLDGSQTVVEEYAP